jgi:hypothetical protein
VTRDVRCVQHYLKRARRWLICQNGLPAHKVANIEENGTNMYCSKARVFSLALAGAIFASTGFASGQRT